MGVGWKISKGCLQLGLGVACSWGLPINEGGFLLDPQHLVK